MTKYVVSRYSGKTDDTLGLLHRISMTGAEFLCYTLEDEERTEKMFGETRIPSGTYKLGLRTHGGFHERYSEKFSFHFGMVEVLDVPGFTDILIHIGNDDDDTAGCLLVGDTASQNITKPGFVGSSTDAYKRVYRKILKDLNAGDCWVEYRNMIV